ncbi:hypothetical protein BC826DRAFT_902746 [Russula brevipes]|nr:hypothetical protein BC826DRAFT_902746 [Russula brevipes]
MLKLLRYSVLPALSLEEGIAQCDIIEGSFDAERFKTFVSWLLEKMNPKPLPISVIVMDGCWIHKCPKILEMCAESQCILYSTVNVH